MEVLTDTGKKCVICIGNKVLDEVAADVWRTAKEQIQSMEFQKTFEVVAKIVEKWQDA